MIMVIKMPIDKAAKSKGMLGGLILIGAGAYIIYAGNPELGLVAIGNGLGIMGIRDAQ